MSVQDKLTGIIHGLSSALEDARKIDDGAYGAKSACKRVRGAAQAAKVELQELRVQVLAAQKGE